MMNQQNQESGPITPSTVPMKRKRGRPRKEESAVQGKNMPVMPGSDNVLNSNQTAGTAADCDDELVGRAVTGVIEGNFQAGYLLNVRVADTDTYLRGLVFLPGLVAPVTAENDVVPHVRMVKRKDILIPDLKPQTHIHGSVPLSGQCTKQPFKPELQVPMSEDQVLPTELDSGVSVLLENQSASIMLPMADLQKNDTSISTGGMPQGISEPGHENQPASITSELECDKTIKQDETLHELDGSRQVKESRADGGATKDSEPAPEPINLFPTIENTDKELRTGRQAVLSVHKLIHDEPRRSNIETVKQDDTLHELDASLLQVKESSAEGGALKDSEPASEPINLVPTIETDNELRTGWQSVPSVHKLIHDEPRRSNSETVKQDETLNELDAFLQVKDSGADAGETKDSQPASELINPVPTIDNTDKELRTGERAVPSVRELNVLIHDEPKRSNTELIQNPISAEPEFMPSEQVNKSVDNFIEKQASPKTDALEDTKTELAVETSSKVDTSNLNVRPSTSVANILDLGEAIPSESKLSSDSGAADRVDDNQPTESESQIGSDNS